MNTFFSKKFLLSSIVLIIGILATLAGLANPNNSGDLMTAGLIITFGTLAYQSEKKRKLELVKFSIWRIVFEIICLLAIILLILLRNDFTNVAYTNPITYVIAPLCAIIAYIIVYFKNYNKK